MTSGLKRGTVKLLPHQEQWIEDAKITIEALNRILGDTVLDIQHIGSTAVSLIHAKPIIDIVVGVQHLQDMMPYVEVMEKNGFMFRGEDIPGQTLFVMAGIEKDLRTHHIHVVKWNGEQWKRYINFRDYLNAYPEKAEMYDACKLELAAQFPEDRKSYTAGKQKTIEGLLAEAEAWRRRK